MSSSIGEPIAGGQAPRGWDELSIRFDNGMDLGKIRALLQQAKERGGISGETITAFNLVAVYFSPEAYERLILDALRGDQTLFTRKDEVEAAWQLVDGILKTIEAPDFPPPRPYEAGSWGPPGAHELLARDGRAWRRP